MTVEPLPDLTNEQIRDTLADLETRIQAERSRTRLKSFLKIMGSVTGLLLVVMFAVAYIDALQERDGAKSELKDTRAELLCRSVTAVVLEDKKLDLVALLGESEVSILDGLAATAAGEPVSPEVIANAQRLGPEIERATQEAREALTARERSLTECSDPDPVIPDP